MKVITVAGMISAGKSTLTELIGEKYNSLAKYEQIPEILSKWYGDARVVTDGERIPFLTQLTFLNSRMNMLRECMTDERSGFAVLDRSIYEDKLFAQIAWEDGGISDSEWQVYCDLLDTMWAELNMIPKKAPDLTVYIRISFETFMERLLKRGRAIEVDNLEANKGYFYKLWSRYDDFMFNQYTQSRVLVIDGDELDFVENESDREVVLQMIHEALIEEGVIKDHKEQQPFPQFIEGKKVKIFPEWYTKQGYTEGIVRGCYSDGCGSMFTIDVEVEGRENKLRLYEGQYEIMEDVTNEIL
ncbi:deoxynucleoside kinase [Bacillus cereus]|uniref:deoxynucleoside kinase n=1 Tax=Bacillus cereus TaxID=1396 RepID=UPI0023E36D51|nr:deoxynucleoside kinase [Bacillus cereus]MDF3555561.1 deoxynucleoside kinase [Bacillus cereus]